MNQTEHAAEPAGPVLSVQDVTKHFGGVEALKGISLDVWPGEVVGLVGDNGAGKSTLVKVISGVHQATSGTLLLEGEQVAFQTPAEARAAGVETVYQDLGLVSAFGVSENFFLGRELTRGGLLGRLGVLRKKEMEEKAEEAVQQLHIKIPGLRSAPMGQMSGGQRQAVAMGKATFWKGKILLLDEPTAALGVEESGEVKALIEHLAHEERLPMIIISHNMEHVWAVCDRIVVLRQGTYVTTLRKEETTPEEVVSYITGANLA
jgi:ABC-type sugar transport system ATPase subunit